MNIIRWSVLLGLSSQIHAMPLKFEEGTLITDSQVEHFFDTVCEPVFPLLSSELKSKVRFHLVNSEAVNAFATKSGHIFVNTGIFLMADYPEEVIGVLLHELGHVAGDHVTQTISLMKNLETRSLFLRILAGVAAGVSAIGGQSAGALPGFLGASSLIDLSMLTEMMHFSRMQEGSADQFAINLLRRLHWSLEGFSRFMEKMVQISGNSNFPMYLRTHPCSSDRLSTIRDAQRRYTSKTLRSTQFDAEFFKIKAKLIGCTVGHHVTSLKHLQNRLSTIPKTYHSFAQSIFLHRKGLTKPALDALTQFESVHQPDAFTWELRAQILFESGQNKQALHAIRTALNFRPKDLNLKAYCAIMELDTQNASEWHKSVRTLEAAVFGSHQDTQLWYWLGIGLGKLNRIGEMHVAMAECALGRGDLEEAKKHTTFALKAFQKWDKRPIHNINLQKYIVRARDLDLMFKQTRAHD